MNCQVCGREYSPGEFFCQQCGASLRDQAVPPPQESSNVPPQEPGAPPKKSFPKWIIAVAVCAALLVVAGIAAAVLLSSPKGNSGAVTYASDATTFVRSAKGDELLAISAGGDVIEVKTGGYPSAYSLDYASAVLVTEKGVLYLFSGGKQVEIARKVEVAAISNDGSTVAYITSLRNDRGELNLYDVGKGTSVIVADNAYADSSYPIVLSPDGKTVAFVGEYEDDAFDGYLSVNGGAPEMLGEYVLPVAVANNADILYYIQLDSGAFDEQEFYIKTVEKGKVKLSSAPPSSLLLNRDRSEALFTDNDRVYFVGKDTEKTKLFSMTYPNIALPYDVATAYNYSFALSSYMSITTYGVDSLKDKVISGYGSVYYLDSGLQSTRISSRSANYNQLISSNFKSLIYLEDRGNLKYVKDLSKPGESATVGTDLGTESYSLDFSASSDLSNIYYKDEDGALYYTKPGGEAKKLADNVESVIVNQETGIAYFIADYSERKERGTLYSSQNGGEPKAVAGGETVATCSYYSGSVWCYVYNSSTREYDFYKIDSGGKLKLLAENVQY